MAEVSQQAVSARETRERACGLREIDSMTLHQLSRPQGDCYRTSE
jgi:hypothetical protein